MSESAVASAGATATVLDRLVEHVRGRGGALDGQECPAAILWTDPKGEWRPALEILLTRVPELFVLGEHRPNVRSGPAIWIRCVIDGGLTEPAIPSGRVPIVYLPEVARQELRAGEECRDALKPLVELMHRGTMWLQPNGSDWTVMAFLTSPKTLSLDVARDRETTEALQRALSEVGLTIVGQLAGRRLQADDFDRMVAGDVVRDLLCWMGDQVGTRARLGGNRWGAFCSRCRDEFRFDPDTDADVVAGEKIAQGEGPWGVVWQRFIESPTSYGDVAGLLKRSRRPGELPFARDRWPDLNEEDERSVREALMNLTTLPHAAASEAITQLEADHGDRRGWVWARLGLAPMAQVLLPLSQLAASARSALGGTTPDDVAAAYLERGWQADAAAWEAIALASAADEKLVGQVVRHLLAPWLEDSARAFQTAVTRTPLPGRGGQPVVEAGEDVCLLFADGLRFDVGQRLAERLEGRGCRVSVGRRWAALPTVTGTSKPAATPVAGSVVGGTLGEDFAPNFASSGQPANAANLREAMRARGYQILGEGALDMPLANPARGWVESGEIDSLGHKLGLRLANQIDAEIGRLAERVIQLLEAGWRAVRIVTDHGWLLLPGGLPKVDLPRHLTASRWSRCAVIVGESSPDVARVPWHWNPSQFFATAPGIACFNRSEEYAHGGVSIQECLIPDLMVERTTEVGVSATITSVTWHGLRCFVVAVARGGQVAADLRLERPAGPSVTKIPKPVDADGSVSLVLAGDEHEASSLVLVLLDDAGHILVHKPTRVGVNS